MNKLSDDQIRLIKSGLMIPSEKMVRMMCQELNVSVFEFRTKTLTDNAIDITFHRLLAKGVPCEKAYRESILI